MNIAKIKTELQRIYKDRNGYDNEISLQLYNKPIAYFLAVQNMERYYWIKDMAADYIACYESQIKHLPKIP